MSEKISLDSSDVFIKDAEVEEISFSSAISRWLNSQKEVHVQYNTLIDLLSNDKI